MKVPPYLQPGDRIAIVCPAGYMAAEKVSSCVRTLKKWGYAVVKGKTVGGRSKNYFSGTDEYRLADLQEFIDDRSVKAILCGRGGYGTTRILDRINWTKFKKHPKWIIGFSDLTVLHGYMHAQLQISSIHGPMAGAFNFENGENRFTFSLKDTLEGKPVVYIEKTHTFNTPGKVTAQVIGGNLCLMAHCIGTNAAFLTAGKILFIEDTGEQLYNIDRMILQLKRTGMFSRLKGLIVGGFTDCKDTERPFGKDAYEIIHEHVKEYSYPKCFGFPISHEKENLAIAVGNKYMLDIQPDQVILSSL